MGECGLWSPLTILLICLGLGFVVQVLLLWGAASEDGPAEAGDVSQFHWHLIVIGPGNGATIEPWMHTASARFPDAHLWCVEIEAGEDDALLLRHLDPEQARVHLVRPTAEDEPMGQQGSLNAAWRRIRLHTATLGHDPDGRAPVSGPVAMRLGVG